MKKLHKLETSSNELYFLLHGKFTVVPLRFLRPGCIDNIVIV